MRPIIKVSLEMRILLHLLMEKLSTDRPAVEFPYKFFGQFLSKELNFFD